MLWIVVKSYKDLRQYLRVHRIEYGVLVDVNQPVPEVLQGVRTAALDFSTADRLTASADSAALPVTALLTAGYENYVYPAAVLADHFHVPGLSPQAALAATDKAVMRKAFTAYDPVITPAFSTVSDWSDIEKFMSLHNFPVMLKPTNLMKSLYITRNDSPAELHTNYPTMQSAMADVSDRIYTMESPGILIEECMTGTMHTVAGWATATGEVTLLPGIVDCITGQDAGKHENYIYSRQLPTTLGATERQAILRTAEQGVKALGLASTMLHIELILTSGGPKIIEIGARVGGYRTRMYEYAYGVDLNGAMLDLAFGRTPTWHQDVARNIAVIELFPDAEGNFMEVSGSESLETLPSLRHYSVKPTVGQAVGRSSRGYKATAIVILGNEDSKQLETDLALVREQIAIVTD